MNKIQIINHCLMRPRGPSLEPAQKSNQYRSETTLIKIRNEPSKGMPNFRMSPEIPFTIKLTSFKMTLECFL